MTWLSRRQLWGLTKLSLLAILLWWAHHTGLLQDAFISLIQLQLTDGSLAFIALGVTLICGVIRWRWILRSLNLPEPSYYLGLKLYYEGLFYNTFAPGAIGGDLLRGHWLRAQDPQHSRLHYFVTLAERAMGLVTLAILGIWAWCGLMWMSLYLIGLVCLMCLIPTLSQFLHHKWPILSFLNHLKRSWICFGLVLNTLSHLISFLIYILIGSSLGINLAITEWIHILSMTVLAANLPLSVAGIGPREVALVTLLAQYGVANHMAVAISMGALAMLVVHALLGGILHVLSPSAPTDR